MASNYSCPGCGTRYQIGRFDPEHPPLCEKCLGPLVPTEDQPEVEGYSAIDDALGKPAIAADSAAPAGEPSSAEATAGEPASAGGPSEPPEDEEVRVELPPETMLSDPPSGPLLGEASSAEAPAGEPAPAEASADKPDLPAPEPGPAAGEPAAPPPAEPAAGPGSSPPNELGQNGPDGRPRYQLAEELRRDLFGVIYRARDRAAGADVEVRFLPREVPAGMLDEIRKHAFLEHANIVRVREVGCRGTQAYVVGELVEGESLVHEGGGELARVCGLVRDAAATVQHAHEKGFFHGDLTPENLLLADRKGQPVVVVKNFGLAFALEGTSPKPLRNPAYLAPELAGQPRKPLTPAGDVYALGATLYALLAGRSPFDGRTPEDVLARAAADEPEGLDKARPEVPNSLATLVRRAMSKDPMHRHKSMKDLSEAINKVILFGLPAKGVEKRSIPSSTRVVPPPPPPPPEAPPVVPAWPLVARRHRLWPAALLLVLLGAGAAAWVLKPWERRGGGEVAVTPTPVVPTPVAPPAVEPARVEVDVQPAPKEVWVDGRPRAEKSLKLAAGRHRFEAKFENGAAVERTLDLTPGQVEWLVVRAHREVARKWEDQEKWAEAERLYREALEAGPAADRPSVEQDLARLARRRLEAEGSVTLESDPPGAEVRLGDRVLGKTPQGLKRPKSGEMVFEFRREGYAAETRRLAYEAGRKEVVRVELRPLTGTVRVKGLRAGDVVRLERKGQEPLSSAAAQDGDLEFTGLRLGEYEAVIRRAGHEEGRGKAVVGDGTVGVILLPELKEKPGTLAVESEPAGAYVSADGKAMGTTPLVLRDVPAGTKKLLLRHADALDWEGEVRVRGEQKAEVKARLTPAGRLDVDAHPEGARVTGAVAGETRAAAKLAVGEYRVRVQHPEAGELERSVRVVAGQTTTVRVDLWDERGKALEGEDRLVEAALAYVKARTEGGEPGLGRVFDTWMGRAERALEARDWAKAREAAERALAMRPRDARAKERFAAAAYEESMIRARAALESRDWKRARAAADEALAARVGDPAAREARGTAIYEDSMARGRQLEAAGKWRQAKDAFDVALGAQPDDPEATRAAGALAVLGWDDRPAFGGFSMAVAFSPTEDVAAFGTFDKMIRLRDVRARKDLQTLSGHGGPITSLAFRPDGREFASASHDKTVRVWNVELGKTIWVGSSHRGPVWSVAFSADGERLASGGDDNTLRIWDVGTGRELQRLAEHSGPVLAAAFSPDGTRVASGSADKTVRLWDVKSGRELRVFAGHSQHVSGVAFRPGGRLLASGGVDRMIKLWDVETGREVRTLEGHPTHVSQVAFHPEGHLLASVGGDASVKVWHVDSGNEVRSLRGHTKEVWSVAFGAGGSLLVTGGGDGVRVWGLKD